MTYDPDVLVPLRPEVEEQPLLPAALEIVLGVGAVVVLAVLVVVLLVLLRQRRR